jgi:choline dehydrogenase-like flavoprotein
MIKSPNSVPKNGSIQTNVCIVGAGAAGITLAREFIGQPFEVCLLESGSMSPHKGTRSLSMGYNIGNSYRPLEYTRSRAFGGTTDVWGGGCEELDELDFEARPWVPQSGWPFPKTHLQPFYARARALCQLPSYAFDKGWENAFLAHLPINGNEITKAILYRSRSSHFAKLYGKELLSASNISLFLNTSVTEIITKSKTKQVTQLRVSTLEGHEFFVKAQLFILATGGIENPRLLLASNRIQKEGLGNQYDVVGRFFMTHPEIDSGVLFPSGSFRSQWYQFHRANIGFPKTTIGLSRKTQFEQALLNLKVTLHATYNESESHGVSSLLYLLKEVSNGRGNFVPNQFAHNSQMIIKDRLKVMSYVFKNLVNLHALTKKIDAFYFTNRLESSPNAESRVLLSTERDQIGMPRIKLDWRLNPIDKFSLSRSHEIFREQITSRGLGRLLIQVDKDESSWPTTLIGPCHHIGTTRMDENPKLGVVNKNCEVHDTSNLYISGSSVFPTSGSAAPTLTIVALALRLADHIKHIIKSTI